MVGGQLSSMVRRLVSAYTFPLAWRWTAPNHSILPADVMASITPVEPGLRDQSDQRSFGAPDIIATDSKSPEQVRQWLTDWSIAPDTVVTVQWTDHLAIETSWSVFSEYWESFCYPSSDDVDVMPVARDWLLQYHHWEAFEFRRAA